MVQSNIDKQTEQAMYLSDSFDFASADPKTKRNLFKNLGADDQFKEAFNLKLDKQADTSYSADENVFRKKAFDMGKALGFDSRNAQLLSGAVDYAPFIGTPSGVNDFFTDLKNKHYLSAGINAVATAASLVPFGKATIKSFKDASQPLNMIVPPDKLNKMNAKAVKETVDNLRTNLVTLNRPVESFQGGPKLSQVEKDEIVKGFNLSLRYETFIKHRQEGERLLSNAIDNLTGKVSDAKLEKAKKQWAEQIVYPPRLTEDSKEVQEMFAYKERGDLVDINLEKNADKVKDLIQLQKKPIQEIEKDIPNFKKLFKGSKLVENGKPILFYRGVKIDTTPSSFLGFTALDDTLGTANVSPKKTGNFDLDYDYNNKGKSLNTAIEEAKNVKKLVWATTNIKQAIGYSGPQSSTNALGDVGYKSAIIPFYANAKKIIVHEATGIPEVGEVGYHPFEPTKYYEWQKFDEQARTLGEGEVLIYRSDVAVDSPEASQADRMLDSLGYDINLERTKTTLRPEKLKDIKVKTPKDAKKFLKSALTGKDSRNLPKQLDDTMIIAFGPEVQIIPAKGKVPELNTLDTPKYQTEDKINYNFNENIPDSGSEYAKGGEVNMAEQTEMAFMSDSIERDPVSGNEVPIGSLAKEVRDDVPAMLSEGEYVVPADVVRFYGVKFFEDLRMKAKLGLQRMDETGRIGGEPVEANKGGIIHASNGVSVANTNAPLTAEQQAEKEAEQISASVTTSSANTGYTAPIQPPSNQAFMQAVGTPLSGSATKSVLYINPQGATLPILVDAQGNPMFGGPPAGAGYVSSTSTQGQQLMQQYGFASADTAATDTGTSTEQVTPETVRNTDNRDERRAAKKLARDAAVIAAEKESAGRIFGVGENGKVSDENLAKYSSLTGMEKIKLIPTELGQMFGGKIDANEQAAIDAYVASPNDEKGNILVDVAKTITGINAAEYLLNKVSNIFGSGSSGSSVSAPKNTAKLLEEVKASKKLRELAEENKVTKNQLAAFKAERNKKYDDEGFALPSGTAGGKTAEEKLSESYDTSTIGSEEEQTYGSGLNKGALVTKPKRKPRVKRKSLGQK